jgi:mannose-6-phosphate isomerase-like protein (cupin superfamily)
MTVITRTESDAASALRLDLGRHVGRYREKRFDWDAFPSNRGYKLLERGQMRFVGAGGSPKVGDTTTLPPVHFTVSLIQQPVGHYAAAHSHEIEEAFLVFGGVLTVGWERDGEVVEVRLGRKDLLMNALGVPHGFRNDDVEPLLMSVMVGNGAPLPPIYRAHPKDVAPEVALALGATDGRVLAYDPRSDHPLMRLMTRHLVRYTDLRPVWDEAGFARMVYVGPGAIEPAQNRKELISLPPGRGVRAYARDTEDAYFVTDGVLTVGWEENGVVVEERIGPRDLAFNPAGRAHYFRNDGVELAQFMMVIGGAQPDPFVHVAA